MRSSRLLHRASALRATGRLVVGHHLQRAWWRYTDRCQRVEAFALGVVASYRELWRRGWRWWVPALLLAPVFLVCLPVLSVVVLLARGLGAAGAAVVLLVLAAVVAAPVLGVVLALMSFTGSDTGTQPARAAGECDPSYPEFCVSDGLGDLDCPLGPGGPPYAPGSNLVVRQPDVHALDGDKDGVGCESSSPVIR